MEGMTKVINESRRWDLYLQQMTSVCKVGQYVAMLCHNKINTPQVQLHSFNVKYIIYIKLNDKNHGPVEIYTE